MATTLTPPQGSEGGVDDRVIEAVLQYYPRLARVRDYVDANLSRPLRLAEVAEVACLEATYFSAYFRKRVGLPFTVWLSRHRACVAAGLLESADHGVKEVARMVGFGSIRSFQRAFRAHFGVTPRFALHKNVIAEAPCGGPTGMSWSLCRGNR